MLKKVNKKPKFIHPVIFKFIKIGGLNFKNSKNNINIRRSSFLKILNKCQFSVHNGKTFYNNDPTFLTILFKSYPFYNFNLGQFSNTRQILNRRSRSGFIIISEDLKKKKGIFIKNKYKKKKFIFKKKK